MPIAPAILDQYVSLIVKADCVANEYSVTYDGTLYDNNGQNYAFADKLYRIDQVMFSNPDKTNFTYVDDVCLSELTALQCGDLGTSYNLTDINRDCLVNMEDLALVASKWLEVTSVTECTEPQDCTYKFNSPSASPQLMFMKADFDQDTDVDIYDLEIIASQWLLSTDPAN